MLLPPDLQFQQDVAARLAADPFLSRFAVIQEAQGHTENDTQAALGVSNAGGVEGKEKGILLTVQITEDGLDSKPDVPGPLETLTLCVRVSEFPQMARETAKAAGKPYLPFPFLSQRTKHLLHQCKLDTAPILYKRASGINSGAGVVGKDVFFTWKPSPQWGDPVIPPTFSPLPNGVYRASCNDPAAVVLVTTDGTLPTPANFAACSAAGEPFVLIPANLAPPGTYLRAAAIVPDSGRVPSGTSFLQA